MSEIGQRSMQSLAESLAQALAGAGLDLRHDPVATVRASGELAKQHCLTHPAQPEQAQRGGISPGLDSIKANVPVDELLIPTNERGRTTASARRVRVPNRVHMFENISLCRKNLHLPTLPYSSPLRLIPICDGSHPPANTSRSAVAGACGRNSNSLLPGTA